MSHVMLPYMFTPRPYQMGIFQARDRDVKNILCVWHRRAGKDKSLVNLVNRESQRRVGAYYYYFPTATWARKAIWNGMDRDGFPFLGHFPKDIIAKVHDREMMVEYVNGSVFQIIGTDNLDVVGVNPVGCVFSEYSLQNPKAYQYVSPIFAENDGWCAFNYTPRGKNHGYKLLKTAQQFPEHWYCEVLDILKTGAISPERVELDIKMGVISRELAEQEYYCSFDYGMEGSILGDYVRQSRDNGRIKDKINHDPDNFVYTFWDIGVRDATSVWFGQYYHDTRTIVMIDHMEESNKGVKWFIDELNKKPYKYGGHFMPHDSQQRDKFYGVSVIEQSRKQGLDVTDIPRTKSLEADIELMRRYFQRFFFSEEICEQGMIALNDWHRDEKTGKPVHDWTSHSVDAFRTAVMALDMGAIKATEKRWDFINGREKRQRKTISEYDPLEW